MLNTFLAHKRPLVVMAVLATFAISALCCRACLPVYDALYLEVACMGSEARTRPFDIQELLLDESVFPEGWRSREPFSPEDRLPAEQLALGFYTYPDPDTSLGAGLDIYRFWGGSKCAAVAYRKNTPSWFAPHPGWGPWTVPTQLWHRSTVADLFQLMCYERRPDGLRTCQAVARYEEYVVLFRTELDGEYPSQMTFTDLERILIAIDERMALYLGKDTP